MMFSKLFGGGNLKPEDLEKLLAQARRHLWRNELRDAHQIFVRARDEVKKQLEKNGNDPQLLSSLNLQAQLGIWAISYLNDPDKRNAVQKILDHENLDADTAHFIARVFQARSDLSSEALTAYRYLLQRDKSASMARRIAELLGTAPFSSRALDLLEIVVGVLPDEQQIAGRLCCWQLYAERNDKATELASKIIRSEPRNLDANRVLAVIAERNSDWETAARHYRVAQEHLRLAVVSAKAGNLKEANEALEQAREKSAQTPTWLYYRGWIAYLQHDISSAIEHWQEFCRKYPQHADSVNEIIESAQAQWLHDQIQSSQINTEMDPLSFRDATCQATLALQIGAARLLLADDTVRSHPLLQLAAQVRHRDVISATYLLLEHAVGKNDQALDKRIYIDLLTHYQDASLFLWLRGITMLRHDQQDGQRYLAKAYQESLCKHHIPVEAVQVANWLNARLNPSTAIDITLGELGDPQIAALSAPSTIRNRFLCAMIPSYTLDRLAQQQETNWAETDWAQSIDRESWRKVLAVHYLAQKNWSRALDCLPSAAPTVRTRIIRMALQDAARQKNWIDVARYVHYGLETCPGDQELTRLEKQLGRHIHQLLWEKGELEKLEFELEKLVRVGDAPTTVYHNLAMAYTRLAIVEDNKTASFRDEKSALLFTSENHRTPAKYTSFLQNEAHNYYWLLAIGYWAVALSDEDYWITWAEQRSSVYAETISIDRIRELIQQTIPRLLREYHEEKVLSQNAFTKHHRFYESIIEHEIEQTHALRYLIRLAKRQQFALPSGLTQFISPLLVKEHGYGSQARDVIQNLDGLNLSPYEGELIRSAFSPLSDVKALVSLKEYDLALLTLRDLLASSKHAALQSDLHQELRQVLKLATQQQIELENWEKALNLATEAKSMQPPSNEFETLQVRAVIGLANKYIREENVPQAIRALERVRKDLKQPQSELDTLLCEASVEWGWEAAQEDDMESAQARFEQALEVEKTNTRAREGLAALYHDKAYDDLQAGRLSLALTRAEKALNYADKPMTRRLLAIILHDLGVQFADTKATTARDYFKRAYKHAQKQWGQEPNEKNLYFYFEMGSAYVLCLYSQKTYAEAINVGEDLLQWRIDHSATHIHLPKLISAVYTDQGAIVYNSGNRQGGRQLMTRALELDPTNQLAQQNLDMA